MSVDERRRHEMYLKLEEVLGSQDAATLMEHLPPSGWADLVTNQSLGLRLDALDLRLEATEQRIRADMRDQMQRVVFWFVPTMLTGVGLAFAAARLG
ncbi:MAG TPA: hypothetical protein VHP57_03100 [Acidimicrobiia bacterium]|nr:hypothetical protein [Acidimicrobiia bacterium]